MKKRWLPYLLLGALLFTLLIFPSQCIEACKASLLLWFNLIIPTLFPFILVSYVIINTEMIHTIDRLLSPLFTRLLNISGSCSIAIIMGFLGGYPMGAVVTNRLYANRLISLSEAKFLLSFTNNASPMFILGFVATLLAQGKSGPTLLLTIYLSTFIVGFIFKMVYRPKPIKDKNLKKQILNPISFQMLDESILDASRILVKVGGYMLLFSIPIFLLQITTPNFVLYQYAISLIELAIGENILATLSCADNLKYAMIASLTAFGSLSVIGQTNSVLTEKDLSIKYYILPKILTAILAFGLTYIII